MSYSNTAMLALSVLMIVNNDILRNKHFRKTADDGKKYRCFLLSVAAFFVCDALWGVLYKAHLTSAVFAVTLLYFVTMSATVFLWTGYMIDHLQEKGWFTDGLRFIGTVFPVFTACALSLNFFNPLVFWFDESGAYHAGGLRHIIMIVQILIYLASSMHTLVNAPKKERSEKRHYYAAGSFCIIMTLMLILQTVFPLLPLYSAGCLLGTCILHTFALEDMEEDLRIELEGLFQRAQEHEQELGSAKRLAYTDSLTGVKNARAYVEAKKYVDQRIMSGELREFGAVVFDVNDLKKTNDTKGHQAGDHLIQAACRLVCRKFKHSPVFRIGGDEFVAFLEGEDYRNRKKLISEFEDTAEEHLKTGSVVVSSGLAVFCPGRDNSYRRIFERADRRMYDRKGILKEMAV